MACRSVCLAVLAGFLVCFGCSAPQDSLPVAAVEEDVRPGPEIPVSEVGTGKLSLLESGKKAPDEMAVPPGVPAVEVTDGHNPGITLTDRIHYAGRMQHSAQLPPSSEDGSAYEYDEQGQVNRAWRVDASGGVYDVDEYVYDEHGRLRVLTDLQPAAVGLIPEHRFLFTYNDRDEVTSRRIQSWRDDVWVENDHGLCTFAYEYDRRGRIAREYREFSSQTMGFTYEYDDEGNMMRISRFYLVDGREVIDEVYPLVTPDA